MKKKQNRNNTSQHSDNDQSHPASINQIVFKTNVKTFFCTKKNNTNYKKDTQNT